jgi:predicted ATP-dependent serine protease
MNQRNDVSHGEIYVGRAKGFRLPPRSVSAPGGCPLSSIIEEPSGVMEIVKNPMVEYLNSLRTQQQSSNATYVHEARRDFLLSLQQEAPWFPDEDQLQVRTRLDALADDIANGALPIRMLLLTGDAGDGKTAFCAALARRLGFEGDLQPETSIGQWRIIKDASEIDEEVLGVCRNERF